MTDSNRMTLGALLFAVALAITIGLISLLFIGFFSKGPFFVCGSISLIASITTVVLVGSLEKMAARIVLTLSILLTLFWIIEILAMAFSKHR